MSEEKSELRGVTTDFLCYWHDEFGFVHISETEKLAEAYEQFKEKLKEDPGVTFIVSSPPPRENFLYKFFKEAPRMSEKIKPGSFLRALVAILVADARSKGAMDDLYLGSIKLPDYGFRFWMLEGAPPDANR